MIWQQTNIHLMGTIIDIMIFHENPQPILLETITQLIAFEHRFSANDDTSELMAINLQAGKNAVAVHQELYQLIKIGKQHSLAKDSFLNIAIGPLTKAWRIGFTDARVPSKQEINGLLRLIDPQKIVLNDKKKTIYLEEGMSLDLGSLAKGFIADLVVQSLKEKGVTSGIINLGGNVVTFGCPPNHHNNDWKIGVQAPLKDKKICDLILRVKNKSVVTSGIYERVLNNNNQSYHHILNPNSGYPISTDVLSLTIVSDKSVDGEIWTTRLFGKKPKDILNEIDLLVGIEGLIITESTIFYSKNMKKYL